jgi:hypothetical protein
VRKQFLKNPIFDAYEADIFKHKRCLAFAGRGCSDTFADRMYYSDSIYKMSTFVMLNLIDFETIYFK